MFLYSYNHNFVVVVTLTSALGLPVGCDMTILAGSNKCTMRRKKIVPVMSRVKQSLTVTAI